MKRYFLVVIKKRMLALIIFLGVIFMISTLDAKVDLAVTETSAQFKKGKFHNTPEITMAGTSEMLGIIKRYITEKRVDIAPKKAIPVTTHSKASLALLSDNELHIVRLGHSSILLKVYGDYWLIDPVFSERASPFSFMGPKRFHAPPISLNELPDLKAVLISHNHYDHLDKASIKILMDKTQMFYVPLGVKSDLVKWQVPKIKVQEFDWWQETHINNTLIAFTPTQHFSGRGLTDGNKTLWGSWVIKTQHDSLYFSGDSGYFDDFKKIGERYGPFDITMIETGAYDRDWADVHMTPEQSIQAHLDLKGKVMMPVHNGTFDLAFHAWYDPFEKVIEKAKINIVQLTTPVIGQVITSKSDVIENFWWQEVM